MTAEDMQLGVEQSTVGGDRPPPVLRTNYLGQNNACLTRFCNFVETKRDLRTSL